MRTKPYGAFSLTMWFLVVVSLGFVVVAVGWLRSAWRALGLLTRGRVTTARIVSVDRSPLRVGDSVSRNTVEVEHVLPDGRTQRARIAVYAEVREGEDVTIVHAPEDPSQATILSALPGRLEATADGRILSLHSTAQVWGLLVLGVSIAAAYAVVLVVWR